MRLPRHGVPLRGARTSERERVLSMGTYAGSALSTLSLLFAMGVGWRQTTTMACVVGIFAAALLWLVVDRPPRRTIPSARCIYH